MQVEVRANNEGHRFVRALREDGSAGVAPVYVNDDGTIRIGAFELAFVDGKGRTTSFRGKVWEPSGDEFKSIATAVSEQVK